MTYYVKSTCILSFNRLVAVTCRHWSTHVTYHSFAASWEHGDDMVISLLVMRLSCDARGYWSDWDMTLSTVAPRRGGFLHTRRPLLQKKCKEMEAPPLCHWSCPASFHGTWIQFSFWLGLQWSSNRRGGAMSIWTVSSSYFWVGGNSCRTPYRDWYPVSWWPAPHGVIPYLSLVSWTASLGHGQVQWDYSFSSGRPKRPANQMSTSSDVVIVVTRIVRH
jgi:hypothetical protein